MLYLVDTFIYYMENIILSLWYFLLDNQSMRMGNEMPNSDSIPVPTGMQIFNFGIHYDILQ